MVFECIPVDLQEFLHLGLSGTLAHGDLAESWS